MRERRVNLHLRDGSLINVEAVDVVLDGFGFIKLFAHPWLGEDDRPTEKWCVTEESSGFKVTELPSNTVEDAEKMALAFFRYHKVTPSSWQETWLPKMRRLRQIQDMRTEFKVND